MLPNSTILNYTNNSSSLFILFRVITTFVFLLFIYLNTTKICNLHKIYTRYILYYIKKVLSRLRNENTKMTEKLAKLFSYCFE